MSNKISQEDFDKLVNQKVEEKAEEIAAQKVSEAFEKQKAEALAKITPPAESDALEEAQKEADKKEWKSGGEFLEAIYRFRAFGELDNRLVFIDKNGQPTVPKNPKKRDVDDAAFKTMTEGTDSAGGFLVFEQFRNDVQEIALEKALVRNNGPMILPMATDTLNIPRIEDTSHASSVFGGMVGYWTEEAGSKEEVQPSWGNCKLTAHELAGYTRASNALLADSAIALEAFLKRAIGETSVYYEDDSYINGNGVGQPLGILNSGALISVTRQANNVVRWVDLINLWSRLLPTSRDRAVWFFNHEVLPQVLQVVSENAAVAATAGSVIFVSKEQGAVKSPPKTIFGRPYFVTEKMAALGSAGDIGVFDLSYYLIGDRSKLAIDSSSHVGFTSNTTYWRFTLRVDGQPWPKSPLTPKNGTNTIGLFVALSSSS